MPANPVHDPALARASTLLQKAQLAGLWLVAIVGAVVARGAFSAYIQEDAYITYRYADNLSSGLGFAFNPGERVLGTTTPLYTLILAVCGLLGGKIPACSEVLFAASTGAIGLLGGLLLRRFSFPNAALIFALLAVSGFAQLFRVWGMETPLLIALLLGSILAVVSGRDVLAGALAGLAFLTRHDAVLYAILLFALLLLRRRRMPWRAGTVCLAIVAPWLLFAWVYFGGVMPNTLQAKLGEIGMRDYMVSAGRIQLSLAWSPLEYARWSFLQSASLGTYLNWALGAGILLACVRLIRRELLLGLLVLYPLALWLGYSVIGPPVEFRWYLMPASFLLLLLGLAGWGAAFERVPFRSTRGLATLALVATGLAGLPAAAQREATEYTGTWQYRARVVAYEEIGDWVLANDLADLTLLTGEPGYFAFRTGSPVIDRAGLVTKGVFFHGDSERRTGTMQLIKRLQPQLIMGTLPFQTAGYVLAYSAFPFRRLLMRVEDHVEHFETLARTFREAGSPESAAAALRHPFHLDVKGKARAEWARMGGALPSAGRPPRLTVAGAPFEEECLYLKSFRKGAETPPFLIDFDRLAFRFAGSDPQLTVVQLVVAGQVVLEQGGENDRRGGELALVSWPVRSWRGRVARLRFVTMARRPHWLAADHIHSVLERDVLPFDDFEDSAGWSTRWSRTLGDAPTDLADVARRYGLAFLGSGRAATSRGLEGERRLVSQPFAVERDRLTFLLFDFAGEGTSVELLVDGEVRRAVRGTERGGVRPITWDLRDLRGREAVLRMTDGEPGSTWIGIDDVYLAND